MPKEDLLEDIKDADVETLEKFVEGMKHGLLSMVGILEIMGDMKLTEALVVQTKSLKKAEEILEEKTNESDDDYNWLLDFLIKTTGEDVYVGDNEDDSYAIEIDTNGSEVNLNSILTGLKIKNMDIKQSSISMKNNWVRFTVIKFA